MPHEHGTYLGGIRTLEDLRMRCCVDPDTGCWHWRLGKSQGAPRIWVRNAKGVRTAMRGRRAALFLESGRDLPEGHVAFARPKCNSLDCVNPGHTMSGSRHQFGKVAAATGRAKTPAKKAGAVKAWAKRQRRFTPEQVDRIRNGGETVASLAREFGVALNSIQQVRQFKTYRSVRAEVPGASVFSWRPTNV